MLLLALFRVHGRAHSALRSSAVQQRLGLRKTPNTLDTLSEHVHACAFAVRLHLPGSEGVQA